MKKSALVLAAAFACLSGLGASRAFAQWFSVPYALRGGWNAVYLHGEASHADLDTLLAAHPEVLSVWRWNPNPTQTEFSASPLIPSAGTPEWSTWRRDNAAGSTLSTLTGQAAYLIECSGAATDTYSVPIVQKALPPRATWVRNGANLLGFPTRFQSATYPLFSTYFATFPVATAPSSKIFKYAGGPLGPANPVQVFSVASERLDRNRAYWFESAVVGNFYAPLEIAPSNPEGLAFGRSGSLVTVRVRNRTSAPVTLTVAPADSAAAPAGQDQITGPVPLKRRSFDAGTASYIETPVATGFDQVIPAQASVELSFTPDRAALTGASDTFYASLLRFTDSANLIDVSLPVSARVSSFAGLWVGDISVNRVVSHAPGATGTGAVARPFPLRVLLHVDDAGVARLLPQVFLGKLAASPATTGLATIESALLASALADATRLVSAHLPLDVPITAGSGSVALGATLVRNVVLPFDDRTNPFVHQYHPDHDNKDARGAPLPAGKESYEVTRVCSFTFSPTPVGDEDSLGWGNTVLGGAYAENVSGLMSYTDPDTTARRDDIDLSGTFILRRVHESGSLTTN